MSDNKDAYYFPHDSNAKDDPKCILLIEQLGPEGYGIFWILLETLRDQPTWKCPINIIPAIARRFNTTVEKVNTVIKAYGLFQIENDEFFCSESFTRRMMSIEMKRQRLISAGRKGGLASSNNKLTTLSDASATVKQPSSSKVKEIKTNQIEDNTMSSKLDYTLPTIYLNRKAKRNFKLNNKATLRLIKARYADGYKLEDFKKVIDSKVSDWLTDAEMCSYLRPSTLFNATKFENYLNQPKKDPYAKYYDAQK